MSDIEGLSSRIMAAMDRVATGLDAMGQADSAGGQALQQALDEEKQVNAQLTERVRVLGERQEQAMAAMEAKAAEAADRMSKLDTEFQQLRQAYEMMSQACETLRDANAAGVADPDQINKALETELQTLRALRKAEMAEADEIMAGLMPLLNVGVQAQQSEEAQ
ncbi:MAG: hypothetical protein AAF999_09285 [Pseudomonadota bacterium]